MKGFVNSEVRLLLDGGKDLKELVTKADAPHRTPVLGGPLEGNRPSVKSIPLGMVSRTLDNLSDFGREQWRISLKWVRGQ